MILSNQTIVEQAIVTPCESTQKRRGMSFGLSYAGYDVTAKLPRDITGYRTTMDHAGVPGVILESGQGILLSVREHMHMPDDVVGFVKDKSTWARQGVVNAQAVIEPGWRGHLSIWITNHGRNDVSVFDGDPIAQVVFMKMDRKPTVGYYGKYQDQGPEAQGPKHD